MAGSRSTHTALRDLVAAGSDTWADALGVAGQLPLRGVMEALEYDFLDEHAENASSFLQAWLAHLGPFEQMEAAAWVADQHMLAMVHIPHSYGIGARIVLESLERVTEATTDALVRLRMFTDGPDAEMSEDSADQLEALAPQLMDVQRAITAIKTAAQDNQSEA